MAKLACIFALVILVCGASAAKPPKGQIQCINDIIGAIPQVQQIITDFANKNYTGAITDLLNFVPVLQQIVTDCSNSTRTSFRHPVLQGDFTKCLSDVTVIAQQLPNLVNVIQSGNITAILAAINQVLPEITAAISDCTFTSLKEAIVAAIPHIEGTGDCLVDISHIVQVLPGVFADIQAQNISAIINDVLSLVPLVQNAVKDCSATRFSPADITPFLNLTTLQGPTQCINDVIAAIPKVQQVITDIQAGNWTGLIVDALNLIPVLQQIVSDCSNATASVQQNWRHLVNFYAEDPKCIETIEQGKFLINTFLHAIVDKKYEQVRELVPEVMTLYRRTYGACSRRKDFIY